MVILLVVGYGLPPSTPEQAMLLMNFHARAAQISSGNLARVSEAGIPIIFSNNGLNKECKV